jgi:hypothetical protein
LLENTVLAAYEVAVEEQCRAAQSQEEIVVETIDSNEMGGDDSDGLSFDADLLRVPEVAYNPTDEV